MSFYPLPYPPDWNRLLTYDWWQALEGVDQDPRHHGEIDLLVHVKAVCDEVQRLPSWPALPEDRRQLLLFTALFHDICKPHTRMVDEEGYIRFPKHAPKGETLTRNLLYQHCPEMEFSVREHICALVRYHGWPLNPFDKTEREYLKTSLRADTRLLADFARADVLGRICNDREDFLERIVYFELRCEEICSAENLRRLEAPHTRFGYFNADKDLYYDWDDTHAKVHLMSGLPGAGKDHFIENQLKGLPVISLDAIRTRMKIKPTDNQGQVIQAAREQARGYLAKGTEFVWNATNITRQMRAGLISFMQPYKPYIRIHYIEKPYRVWQKQNREREAAVPEKVLAHLLSKLEPPTRDEAHEVFYHVS